MTIWILALFLIALTPSCIATAYRFTKAREELTTRSTYYKKKRGYKGKPGLFKTLQLMRETEHLNQDFVNLITLWGLAIMVSVFLLWHLS